MIDLEHESLISLAEAATLLPRRRKGKKPHISCLYRWASRGLRGVRLETVQIGGTRCTSREALARFFASLTEGCNQPKESRSPTARQRAARQAERELEKLGL